MAADPGLPPHALTWQEQLAARPGSFGFHVALRRFEASSPEAPRLGEAEHPSEERLRLGQIPSAAFEATELACFSPGDGGAPARLAVTFFGLWGPQGPLPAHLTEHAVDRLRHAGDVTLARFADVFHHRLLLLLHRAWAKTQPTTSMDRPSSDAFARYVGALMGLGLEATRNRGGVHDFVKLHYAPRFASSSRSAEGLRDLLGDYLGLPIAIEELVREPVGVPRDERWRLGVSRESGALGRAVLGARAWSCGHKFRVVVGPLRREQIDRLLPGAEAFAAVASLVRLYTNDEWAWELRLVLADAEGCRMRLGRGARLGWSTRLGARDATPANVDLVVDGESGRTRRLPRSGSCWERTP